MNPLVITESSFAPVIRNVTRHEGETNSFLDIFLSKISDTNFAEQSQCCLNVSILSLNVNIIRVLNVKILLQKLLLIIYFLHLLNE